jgi:hypothetical protein
MNAHLSADAFRSLFQTMAARGVGVRSRERRVLTAAQSVVVSRRFWFRRGFGPPTPRQPRSCFAAEVATVHRKRDSPVPASCCRHGYKRRTPALRATCEAFASGSFCAKTRRIFSAWVQCRRLGPYCNFNDVTRRRLFESGLKPICGALRRSADFSDCEGNRRSSNAGPPHSSPVSIGVDSLTPGPPPFCGMNTTPAVSRAARMAEIVEA